MFAPKSELARHSQPGGTRDDEDDSWVIAGENESVDSFLTNCPPSFMEKSWISASHDGMTQLIEEYYTTTLGAEGTRGRDNMDEIKAAWEEAEVKTVETLTALLKEYKFGCGKWMIFVNAADVDSTWRKVVTALWDGKLGHSAKVSGNTPECNGSHVINVFVDPFWEVSEVERVLSALRELCDVKDAIKFKADGVSQLGLGKANEYGIPPSFYAANRGSQTVVMQKPSTKGNKWGDGKSGEEMGSARSARDDKWGARDDKWGSRGNTWVKREAPKAPKSAPVAAPTKADKAAPKKVSAFAALAGVEDDDAEAIIAKKKEKKEKKKAKKKEQEEAAKAEVAKDFAALTAGLKSNWGDMEDDEDDEKPEEEDSSADDDSDEEESEEEESEEEAAAEEEPPKAAAAAAVPDISDAPAKKKTAEELEVEALLESLDASDKGAAAEGGDEPKLSKAAAKRAKKKAAAAGDAPAAAAGEPAEAENAPENASEGGAAPKSAEEIKKMMAAKAAAKKKEASKGGSSAAAAVMAETKAREAAGGKKKKAAKTWETQGKQVGQKARGSDNKYQGE